MRSTIGSAMIAWVLTLNVLGCGLAPQGSGPYVSQQQSQRNPIEAQRLTLEAVDVMMSDPETAEALLREALTADLFHGPAHNNLGAIHLARGEIYEAATEFEWARKLMPGHPDPRVNLGLALERGGRVDQAIDSFQAAREVYPGHIPAAQALARAQIRHGMTDTETSALLDEIALRGDSEQWRSWAKLQQIRLAE